MNTEQGKKRGTDEQGKKIRSLTVPAGHWCHVDVFDDDNTGSADSVS